MAEREPLTNDERESIVTAVKSVFAKLTNLHREIAPAYQRYGFTTPSAGVAARDLSEKIEAAIIQHTSSFTKGEGHCDLSRAGCDWEVKICQDSGLTINQSKQIGGENYIVVNYHDTKRVSVWVLWQARDEFFSARRANSNARSMLKRVAVENVEVLYTIAREQPTDRKNQPAILNATRKMAKAALARRLKRVRVS